MNKFNFATEAEYRVNNTNEVRELIRNRLNVHHKYVSSSDLSITEDYKIQMRGEKFRATQHGFGQILKVAGFTNKTFWKRLSAKTLQLIFDDLKKKQNGQTWKLFTRDHTILNAVRPPHHPVTILEVLDMIDDLAATYEVEKIAIGDRGLRASLIDPTLELHPSTTEIGEVTKVGMSMEGSETGFGHLAVSAFLYRLKCKNGSIASEKFGGLRWNPDNLKNRAAIKQFKANLRNLSLDTNRLVKSFKQLYENNLTDVAFWKTWKKVHAVVGTTSEADGIVGVDKDQRLDIQKAIKQRKSYYQKRHNTSKIPGKPTDISAFKVHNSITDQASHYSFVTQRSLERVGGGILDLVTENGNEG